MLERLMGIITLKPPTYKAVAEDQSLTQEAMMIVIAVAVVNAIVSLIISVTSGVSMVGALLGAVVNVVIGLVVWYAGAWLLAFVAGKFGGKTDTNEMLRVTGHVYIFNLVNVLSILVVISPAMLCLTSPLSLVAAVLGLIGYVIGVREAAEFSTQNAIITSVIVTVIVFIIAAIGGTVAALAMSML